MEVDVSRVLVPLAPGFEEIEAVTVIDVLRRAGVDVVSAGTIPGPIEGSRGVRVLADALLRDVDGEDFDLVVLPGGIDGSENLRGDERVIRILRAASEGGRPIAAICAAPTILQGLGLLRGRRATCHPTVADRMEGVDLTEERVVIDGDRITSRAAGTAMEFALALVERLEGSPKRREVASGLLAQD
jgi:4-methyl-5(b-hydroxyethyl)-thiazole monophosphate biosynthesis